MAAKQAGEDISSFLSTNLLSACDLSAAMARLFCAVAQGQIKPKVASTLAYLSQTMIQSIPIARHEYCEAFSSDSWRRAIRSSFNVPASPPKPAPQPAPPAPSPASQLTPRPVPQPTSQPTPPPAPQSKLPTPPPELQPSPQSKSQPTPPSAPKPAPQSQSPQPQSPQLQSTPQEWPQFRPAREPLRGGPS
jgi:hypothetical protein